MKATTRVSSLADSAEEFDHGPEEDSSPGPNPAVINNDGREVTAGPDESPPVSHTSKDGKMDIDPPPYGGDPAHGNANSAAQGMLLKQK